MDIQPINAGHVLVAPDGHSACLGDLPENTGARMFGIAQRISAALHESGLDCEGVNLFLADGDGFGLRFGPDYANGPDRETLEVTAKRIRDAL
jgi:diadenosine tetraphosphate (Ap4A) HIT family hydrolase